MGISNSGDILGAKTDMQWGPSSPIEQSFELEGTRVVTHMELSSPPMSPRHLESASELTAQVNANGSIRRMSHRGVLLNLFLGNEVEGGPAYISRETNGG